MVIYGPQARGQGPKNQRHNDGDERNPKRNKTTSTFEEREARRKANAAAGAEKDKNKPVVPNAAASGTAPIT